MAVAKLRQVTANRFDFIREQGRRKRKNFRKCPYLCGFLRCKLAKAVLPGNSPEITANGPDNWEKCPCWHGEITARILAARRRFLRRGDAFPLENKGTGYPFCGGGF